MRTTIAAAAIVAALAGCSAPAAEPAAPPAPTVTVTATPETAEPTGEPALDIIAWMDYQVPGWEDYGTRAEMRELADLICETLGLGVPMVDIASAVHESLPAEVGAAVIVGAIGVQCPEFQDAVNDYAGVVGEW